MTNLTTKHLKSPPIRIHYKSEVQNWRLTRPVLAYTLFGLQCFCWSCRFVCFLDGASCSKNLGYLEVWHTIPRAYAALPSCGREVAPSCGGSVALRFVTLTHPLHSLILPAWSLPAFHFWALWSNKGKGRTQAALPKKQGISIYMHEENFYNEYKKKPTFFKN